MALEGKNGAALAVVATPSATQMTNATTALEPNSVEQAFWMATQLCKSGLLGKSVSRPETAFAVIIAGRELGLTVMQSLRSIHVVDGKPTLSADLMVALVKRSPACRYFRMVESTAKVARYVTERIGEGETPMEFTIEEAQAAGVATKDVWKKYPKAMLRARCIAALARAVYPDILAGIYDEDELSDVPREPRAVVIEPTVELDPVEPEAVVEDAPSPVTRTQTLTEEGWVALFGAAESMEQVEELRAKAKANLPPGRYGLGTPIALAYATATKRLRVKPEVK